MKSKKIIALILGAVLITAGFAGCQKSNVVEENATAYFANFPDDKNVISATDFLNKVAAGDSMVILDIRQADAYAQGHVTGAINVPFGSAIADNLKYIPNDTPVYIYCYTGQTAAQTVALLNVAGIDATTVQSGFNNGISKVENYTQYIDTTAVSMPTKTYKVDSKIQEAVDNYCSDIDAAKGTDYANLNISPATVKAALDANNGEYYILSVRQAADYATAHIQGAVNIPFGKGMQESFSKLPKDQKIVVYCYTGQTASQTVAILRLLGYDAYNMSGGMNNGWIPAGYPTVTN
ncbi:MAG: rhodanese-like domain-containing protein [Anaerofustis sp.]